MDEDKLSIMESLILIKSLDFLDPLNQSQKVDQFAQKLQERVYRLYTLMLGNFPLFKVLQVMKLFLNLHQVYKDLFVSLETTLK